MVVVRRQGRARLFVAGPLTTTGLVHFPAEAEYLWLRFALGTFMPHRRNSAVLDVETLLPAAGDGSFWLQGAAWQFPNYENVDTFVSRLARQGLLAHDPVVAAALRGEPTGLAERTVRHRCLRATGQTQTRILQVARARRAAALLREGCSILDTVEAAGYFDQPHLTRALRRWVGYTPAQLARQHDPACRSVQDAAPAGGYAVEVFATAR